MILKLLKRLLKKTSVKLVKVSVYLNEINKEVCIINNEKNKKIKIVKVEDCVVVYDEYFKSPKLGNLIKVEKLAKEKK